MTLEIGYLFLLLAVGLGLFASDRLRIDVVALILLLALTIPKVITPAQALAGFGSETILVLIALFVMTEGIIRTGVVERLGLRLASLGSTRPVLFSRFLIIAVTVVSSFVSNTVTTAVFLPIVVGAAARAQIPASKLLMPVAFGSILSSGVTLIGTSTNLVVSGQLPRLGMEPLGFFEMAHVGVACSILGLVYLVTWAPRLIPDRGADEPSQEAVARTYFAEVVIPGDSPLAGKALVDGRFSDAVDLRVVGVRRGTRGLLAPEAAGELQPGDELVIAGRAQDILSVKDVQGIDIKPDVELAAQEETEEEEGEKKEPARMVEALVLPRSRLVGRTLRAVRFRERTGLSVLALHPGGVRRRVRNLSRLRLRPNDLLLLQGTPDALAAVPHDELLVLDDLSAHHPRSPKGFWAATIFVGALVLGGTGILALPIAFLLGVLAMVLSGCLTADEAYASVDWRLLVLIGSMMAFGTALESSGASSWIATGVVTHLERFGPWTVMGAFYVLTVLLSQAMSNQAAALIVLPVAAQTAQSLGIEPRTFVITVTLAASCSFLTPLEPSCVLVYGPGGYRFSDFLRVGAPLTLIVFVVTMALVPVFWPFTRL